MRAEDPRSTVTEDVAAGAGRGCTIEPLVEHVDVGARGDARLVVGGEGDAATLQQANQREGLAAGFSAGFTADFTAGFEAR